MQRGQPLAAAVKHTQRATEHEEGPGGAVDDEVNEDRHWRLPYREHVLVGKKAGLQELVYIEGYHHTRKLSTKSEPLVS